ncbi:hypothetical protein BV898_04733 [Hypsibius exemplaris]|uniref:Ephrin RBD domain-containing protein n=1 Tax=Hypsibius exemplaris TaxID=2072580 RepID=A0A1W0X1C9_HYPEX|nr:hypothetical protein BV898_04733 [Hypsibius exemplaris]
MRERPNCLTSLAALVLYLFHSAVSLAGDPRELRLFHPKYPPIVWFPEFAMFNNRTNPARIVVQMHDSLDFFCPDYINSQYQSFTGAKKLPSEYGAEEIYMVDGQDYQACFGPTGQSSSSRGRLAKKHARLLLRCPGKTADTKIKAKFQYTVSFRMFSPVPKGPEFNCNSEYYFLGIFPGHNHDEDAIEKALCSTSALRLQIFVSCSDNAHHHNFFPYPSPNVIQLDRPAQSSELLSAGTTTPSANFAKSPLSAVHSSSSSSSSTASISDLPVGRENGKTLAAAATHRPANAKSRSGRPTSHSAAASQPPASTGSAAINVARSDRKIMRNNGGDHSRHLSPSPRRMMQPPSVTVASKETGTTLPPAIEDADQDTLLIVDGDFDGELHVVTPPSSRAAGGGGKKPTTASSSSKGSLKRLAFNRSSPALTSRHSLHCLSTLFWLLLVRSLWPNVRIFT